MNSCEMARWWSRAVAGQVQAPGNAAPRTRRSVGCLGAIEGPEEGRSSSQPKSHPFSRRSFISWIARSLQGVNRHQFCLGWPAQLAGPSSACRWGDCALHPLSSRRNGDSRAMCQDLHGCRWHLWFRGIDDSADTPKHWSFLNGHAGTSHAPSSATFPRSYAGVPRAGRDSESFARAHAPPALRPAGCSGQATGNSAVQRLKSAENNATWTL